MNFPRMPKIPRVKPPPPPGERQAPATLAQKGPGPLLPRPLTCPRLPTAFSQMVISFYYGGKLVGQTTTTCPEGCRLSLGQPGLPGGKLCGPEGLELVRFPPADAIPSERQRQVTRKLFGHLERGVLLHSSRQGVLVKRQCQGRVFYSGNAAAGRGGPNKLERDEVVKVFDTSQFFRGQSRPASLPPVRPGVAGGGEAPARGQQGGPAFEPCPFSPSHPGPSLPDSRRLEGVPAEGAPVRFFPCAAVRGLRNLAPCHVVGGCPRALGSWLLTQSLRPQLGPARSESAAWQGPRAAVSTS